MAALAVGTALAAGACALLAGRLPTGTVPQLCCFALGATLAVGAVCAEHSAAPSGAQSDTPRSEPLAVACTMVVLFKIVVFAYFALWAEEAGVASGLATTSRALLLTHTALCAMGMAVLGAAAKHIPNVFPEYPPGGPRNPLSLWFMASGALVAVLGVGLRGLRRRHREIDACAVAGLQAPTRILGMLVLDAPHLVLGVVALVTEVERGARILGCVVAVAGASGVAVGAKAFLVDVRWFWYGTEYAQRKALLESRMRAAARWGAMQHHLRLAKHNNRLLRDAEREQELAREQLGSDS